MLYVYLETVTLLNNIFEFNYEFMRSYYEEIIL